MKTANPVLVEVTRGAFTESRHRGAAVAVEADGAVVAAWGEVEARTLPRSAVKPLQALALVESGAAERFALSDAELALACASHAGEPRHVEAVAAWLARLGLGEADLACGGHEPASAKAARALAAAGETPGRLHDNCSGKHAGMLTLARHLGAACAGYERLEHPVQRRIRDVLSDMAEVALGDADAAVDGCGVPTFALPLRCIALAFARFARAGDLPPARAEAARRLVGAMAAEPFMVAGTGRLDTRAITASGGRVLAKAGAEGVHVAAWRERGIGVAVKIDDGARRAAELAVVCVLERLGALGAAERRALARHLAPEIATRAGEPAGEMRAVF
jgi:L-asparaginase II